MPGCPSPNPLAGIRQKQPPSEAPAVVVQDATIDQELVGLVNRRKYLQALKRAIEAGQPGAADRYERALSAQQPPPAAASPRRDLSRLSEEQLEQLMHLLEIADGVEPEPPRAPWPGEPGYVPAFTSKEIAPADWPPVEERTKAAPLMGKATLAPLRDDQLPPEELERLKGIRVVCIDSGEGNSLTRGLERRGMLDSMRNL